MGIPCQAAQELDGGNKDDVGSYVAAQRSGRAALSGALELLKIEAGLVLIQKAIARARMYDVSHLGVGLLRFMGGVLPGTQFPAKVGEERGG